MRVSSTGWRIGGLGLALAALAAVALSNRVLQTPEPAPPSLLPLPGDDPAVRSEPARPSLVIVTLDTTRADRLGCYGGSVKTPNLDALAARGVRFAHATASAPITLPSHASLFTGLDPQRHGVRENGTHVLGDAQLTLAEILRSQGWRTGAFIGGFPLSARFGLAQGFDHYDDALAEDNPGPPRKELWQGVARPYVDRPAGPVVRRAVRWIHANADAPFFAWVHLFDAHNAYQPPEPFATRYRGRLYDGEIAYMDSVLRELFDSLARWDLASDTLVVVAADHGESLGEHGIEGHGRDLYEPALNVPLLAAFPGRIDAAQVVNESVRNVDLLPTLLELLELAVPPRLDGRSLVAALRAKGNGALPPADAYAETLMPRLRFGGPERYALQRGAWKLLREVAPDRRVSERLFHLGDDPGELRDRAAEAVAVRSALAAALDARIAAGGAAVGPAALDAESEAALRALGYID